MARTAPAPNIPPIPGMCPSLLVAAGGSDSGGSGGQGAGSGGGGGPGSGSGAADGTGGDGTGAPDPKKYPLCGTKSHPVDVVTGRAFTHPIVDFETGGPLPFVFERSASSAIFARDFGMGPTWAHSLGWQIEERRDAVWVFTDKGTKVAFPLVGQGDAALGPFGWRLVHDLQGYEVDADDGLYRRFGEVRETRAKLVEVRDRNYNRIALSYDAKGHLELVTDSGDRAIRVHCDGAGHITAFFVQPRPGEWIKLAEYTYDGGGRLVSATDADGHSHAYEYSDRNQLTLDQDRSGLRFHFRFDAQARCIESWGDYGDKPDPSLAEGLPEFLHDGVTRCKGIHHCVFDWGDDGHSVVTDSTQSSNFFGNKFGLVDKWVEGGAATTASYRDDGHLMALTNAEGGTTEWRRDARGRVTSVTDPLKRVTTFERDGYGLPVRVVDPEGGEIVITRDLRGNVVSSLDAAGGFTQTERDARGLLTKEIDAAGATTTVQYDAQGSLSSVTQPDGGVWRYAHDFLGRSITSTNPLGHTTTRAYSTRGDLVAVQDALGQTTHYRFDGESHLTFVQSPKGHTTQLVWGGYHKVCSRRDANGNIVRLGYDVEGELTHVWNEKGELHRLSYTPAGVLTDEHTFDGRHLQYKHDKLGQPIQIRGGDRKVTELEYDAVGQLLKRTGHDEAVDTFEYNLRGELVRARSAGGIETVFERDVLGQVVREQQVIGGVAHEVKIALGPTGERLGRTTSLGHTEEVVRDRMGDRRRTTLDGRVVDQIRDGLGQELRRALSGGGLLENAYDPLGRLSDRRSVTPVANIGVVSGKPGWVGAQPNGVTAQKAFQYDADGELIAGLDVSQGKTDYRYDPIGHLLAMVPEQARAELFRYDPNGNLYEADDGATRVYGPGNRLLKQGHTHFVWDADGHIVEKRAYDRDPGAGDTPITSWKYTWSSAGLMSRAECSDGLVVEFAYDAFARRLEKRVGRRAPGGKVIAEKRIRFVWDGEVLVHEIREEGLASGVPIVEERTYWFEDDGFEPLAHREKRRDDLGGETSGWVHYLNDPIGTPERLVDERGEIAAEYRRMAWGKLEQVGNARASTPLRLQGQYWDEETGLAYNRWRYYDGEGTFVSADPMGLEAHIHSFRFVLNPTAWLDPSGLSGTNKRRKRKREKLAASVAADRPGANRGCATQLTRREADRMGEEFVGPNPIRMTGRNGNMILVNQQQTRRYRSADSKRESFDARGRPHSRTGTQANFETGNNLALPRPQAQVATNTHIDIID